MDVNIRGLLDFYSCTLGEDNIGYDIPRISAAVFLTDTIEIYFSWLMLDMLNVYIHITAASRAVWYIARACAGDILYVPEGFSPRRTYFRIARRAHRARVLYDFSAREARLIWNISTRGSSF